MFLNKEGVINPKIVLVTIAYFGSLRNDFILFPISISCMVRGLVSLRRVRAFLEAEEVNVSSVLSRLIRGPRSDQPFNPTQDSKYLLLNP